ncbi:MAG: MGH1-like glycoside hydrolase domain-containing protein [Anaerolineales bacterium]
MRTWNWKADELGRWIVAADARLPGLDLADDQIWELRPGGGEPSSLAIETTFGLRARGMRIFPLVSVEGQNLVDPAAFSQGPVVHTLLPNYLFLSARPLAALQMNLEYWVHDSHSLLGRITLINRGEAGAAVELRLNALLQAGEAGGPFSGIQIDGVHVLAGEIEQLEPVIFLEGGAGSPPSAFPALGVQATLAAGRSRSWVWAHAGETERRASFDRARLLCGMPWEPNIARLKLLNSGLLDIETGNPDWDTAFWLTQVAAVQAFAGPGRQSAAPGLVGRRSPRDGFSTTGDGSDYDGAWGGVDASLAHFVSRQILFAAPELVQGEIRNRVKAVNAAGEMDGRPGPGGQRAGWESMPLLGELTWRLFERTHDRNLLLQVYPALRDSARRWLNTLNDHDQDGYPEWRFLPQTGFGAWPAFVGWERWGQGLEISKVERPDLATYFFAECTALAAIAQVIGEDRDIPWLQSACHTIRGELESVWSEKAAIFHSRDRDLDRPLEGERLGRQKGTFRLDLKQDFEEPVRLLLRTFGEESAAKNLTVAIQGKGRTHRKMVEEFTYRRYQWFWKMGCVTAEKLATRLDAVRIAGLDESFTTEVWLADTTRQDAGSLLPLWAGMITAEQAERLIQGSILDTKRFWRRFGLPTVSARDSAYHPEREGNPGSVWMFSNTLFVEGLLRYGHRQHAAELVGRLMSAVIERLRKKREFGTYYHPDEPVPLGDDHAFEGLAPLDVFLESLGLQMHHPARVRVEPGNPYPWPVTIRWRGLTVKFQGEQVMIGFPDGASVRVSGSGRQWVEQDLQAVD